MHYCEICLKWKVVAEMKWKIVYRGVLMALSLFELINLHLRCEIRMQRRWGGSSLPEVDVLPWWHAGSPHLRIPRLTQTQKTPLPRVLPEPRQNILVSCCRALTEAANAFYSFALSPLLSQDKVLRATRKKKMKSEISVLTIFFSQDPIQVIDLRRMKSR